MCETLSSDGGSRYRDSFVGLGLVGILAFFDDMSLWAVN